MPKVHSDITDTNEAVDSLCKGFTGCYHVQINEVNQRNIFPEANQSSATTLPVD